MNDEKILLDKEEMIRQSQTQTEPVGQNEEMTVDGNASASDENHVYESQNDVVLVIEEAGNEQTEAKPEGETANADNASAADGNDKAFITTVGDLGERAHEWFKLEQKIKVRSENLAEDELYETHVRDFAADRLYLDIPKAEGAFVVPPMGSKILANFIFKNNVYFFETNIVSITRLQGVPVWVLDMPTEFKRIQRRSFLRMDVLLPVRIRIESREGVFLPSVKTHCLDISAGGVRYVLDFPINSGKLAKLSVDDFPGIGRMEALCKAVRSVKSAHSEENYWVGAQFVDLPYKIEDKIVRHIFKIQKRVVISSSTE